MGAPNAIPVLIADIGGTNARFAIDRGHGAECAIILRCADYPDPAAAARAYLERANWDEPIKRAAFAVAAPVQDDWVAVTNNHWRFSIAATQAELQLERLEIVNDFAAQALALPYLGAAERFAVQPSQIGANPKGTKVAIGPGTGLGIAGLAQVGAQWIALPGEGGHASLAPQDAREDAVVGFLRKEFAHVSAERVLSGPGLSNLYRALSTLEGKASETLAPADVTVRALQRSCPVCVEALDMFFAILGGVAGDVALLLGAVGGVYITGGIVPRMPEALAASRFRRRFEAKGRSSHYPKRIPTWVVMHPTPAFLGLAAVARTER